MITPFIRRPLRSLRLLAAVCASTLASTLAVAACGKHDAPTAPPPQGTPSLALERDTMTLSFGEKATLAAEARDAKGSIVPTAPVSWTSGTPSVATVDGSGVIRALSPGEATITATWNGVRTTARINVVKQFVQIATGGWHTCGLVASGRVYCWGSDLVGELGVRSTSPDCLSIGGHCSSRPLPVVLPGRAIAVAAGDWHSCAIVEGGAAYCWGANYYGQLGGGLNQFSYDTPQRVAGGLTFGSIAAGRFHTCGITTTSDTYCWGEDYYTQLGGGIVPNDRCSYFFDNEPCSRTPMQVVGGHSFKSLTASDRATCALTIEGSTFCWGMEVGGADGTICQGGERPDCTRTPVPAAAGFTFTSIGMSQVAKCGIDAGGTISCWGYDYYGMFGNGTKTTQASTPVTAANGAHWASFVVGFSHVCALTQSGGAACWGASPDGEVGDGSSATEQLLPTPVAAGGAQFTALFSTAQSPFNCGLLTTSRVLCWGMGTAGELGNGALSSSATPVEVTLPN